MMLWLSRISIVRLLSPVVIFGATLPTGSINGKCDSFVEMKTFEIIRVVFSRDSQIA